MICKDCKTFSTMINRNRPIIGIDYGKKKVGMALSVLEHTLALPLKFYYRKEISTDIAYIKSLVNERGISGVVIGLPDSHNTWIKLIDQFACMLMEELGLAIYFEDETLSTKYAQERLHGMKKAYIEKSEDMTAATIILQRTLDKLACCFPDEHTTL